MIWERVRRKTAMMGKEGTTGPREFKGLSLRGGPARATE